MRLWLLLALVVGAPLVAIPVLAEIASPASFRAAIDRQYPGVPWIETSALAKGLATTQRAPWEVLDVRERAEFAVSHIRGARQVNPDLTDVTSLAIPEGTHIVVYCSVGYRSAALGRRLMDAGYEVSNLEGGLFQWANEGRPLYRGASRAEQVHPYDDDWGRFLLEQYRHRL